MPGLADVPHDPHAARRRLRAGVALLVGAAALVGAVEVRARAPLGSPAPSWRAGTAAALLAVSLVVPILAAVVVTRRRPVVGRHWVRRLRRHLAAAVAAAAGAAGVEDAAHQVLPWAAMPLTPTLVAAGLAWYVLTAGAAHVFVLVRRARHAHAVRLRIVRASEQAGREQVAAQFRAAKTELHPALITSALATAQALVSRDPAAAERVIVELGLLMREAVAGAGADVVTLGEEIDAARERSDGERFADDGSAGESPPSSSSTVRFVVDDGVRDLLVPHLVIPALLACAQEAGWASSGVVVRGRRVTPAREPGLELSVEAVHGARPVLRLATDARPAPRLPAARSPEAHAIDGGALATSVAGAVLRRLLHHVYGDGDEDGDVRWQLSTGVTTAGAQCVYLRLPAVTDDQLATPAPARPAGPGEQGSEDWAAWTSNDAGYRSEADILIVAGLVALAAAHRWRDAMTTYGTGWYAGAVLFSAGAGSLTVALMGAAAVWAARRWSSNPAELFGYEFRRQAAVGLGVAILAAGLRAASEHVAHAAGLTAAAPLSTSRVAGRVGGLLVLYAVFVMVARLALLGRAHRRAAQVVTRAHAVYRSRAAGRRQSELRALKAELNPHFVGNALHTAAALVRTAPEATGDLLAALSTLASRAGAQVDVQEVNLLDEIAGLDPFLALERARLGTAGGQLTVAWDVTPEAAKAVVPHLVLQPLVENAVRHGLAPRGGQGRVTIRARHAGKHLELAVVDDGVGVRAAQDDAGRGADGAAQSTAVGCTGDFAVGTLGGLQPGTGGLGCGAGLRGVRQRLALLYGAGATCVLEPNPEGGAIVCLILPYRQIAPSDSAGQLLAAAGG